MPEVIQQHKGPIAVIPPQSLAEAAVHQLTQKFNRARAKETKDMIGLQLKEAKLKHNAILVSLGREPAHKDV